MISAHVKLVHALLKWTWIGLLVLCIEIPVIEIVLIFLLLKRLILRLSGEKRPFREYTMAVMKTHEYMKSLLPQDKSRRRSEPITFEEILFYDFVDGD